MTRPKARRMWAIITESGYTMAHPKWSKADARLETRTGERIVRVSIQELHPRKKARRG